MAVPNRRHRRNFNDPGDAHELTFCCYKGYPFLKADRTCQWLSDAIHKARAELKTDIWAFVFMPEHVHVIVRPRLLQYDIARIRRAIKEPVARAAFSYLRRHAPAWIPRLTRRRAKRVEHVFWQSGGGYDRNIKEPKTLLAMMEYIHLNPVRRGLVQRAVDWHWSSAAHYEGAGESPVPLDPIPPEWVEGD